MSTPVPAELKYTASHEWARRNDDGTVTIGITDHAQHALGDIVFVDAPTADRHVDAGEACAVVESVKAASDVYSPIEGVVVEGNAALAGAPELVNSSPYGEGWLFRIKPTSDAGIEALLSADAYQQLLSAAGE